MNTYTIFEASGNKEVVKGFLNLINHIWISKLTWPNTTTLPTLQELTDIASFPIEMNDPKKQKVTIYHGIV